MALLLDTHAFLWFLADDPRLGATASDRIQDPMERVVVSVASAWEIVIKIGTGKLVLDRPLVELWPAALAKYRFESLDVGFDHVAAVAELPQHHRDPFDRLLIAQARAEGLDIASADSALDAYPVTRVW